MSEDLFKLLTKEEGADQVSMLEPDGADLDELIGELQSTWGVPQYPQEYRITIKVAEKGSGNGGPAPEEKTDAGPRRERAPSPARLAAGEEPQREKAPSRRRRRGRRRRGGGSGGPGGSPSGPSGSGGGGSPAS